MFETHPDFVNQNLVKGTVLTYLALLLGYQNTDFLCDVFILPSLIGVNLLGDLTPEEFQKRLSSGGISNEDDFQKNISYVKSRMGRHLSFEYSFSLIQLSLENILERNGPKELSEKEITLFEFLFVQLNCFDRFNFSFQKGSLHSLFDLFSEINFDDNNFKDLFLKRLQEVVIETDQDKGGAA